MYDRNRPNYNPIKIRVSHSILHKGDVDTKPFKVFTLKEEFTNYIKHYFSRTGPKKKKPSKLLTKFKNLIVL